MCIMRKFILFFAVFISAMCLNSCGIRNNEIWYLSSDGNIVVPYSGTDNNYASALKTFGANIISNTYKNGKGVIKFDGDVTSIGLGAFVGCENLATITIPRSVKRIGESAFEDCSYLGRIIIPNKVTEIEPRTFKGCFNLIECPIGNKIVKIGESAFEDCSSLVCMTIPNSVISIGKSAFEDCSSLENAIIPESVTEIGYYAFKGCTGELIIRSKIVEYDDNDIYTHNNYLHDNRFRKIIIGDNICKIGDCFFKDFSLLESVIIPDSVTEIGSEAFYGCTSLTSITIPNSVSWIGYQAFSCCASLKTFYGKFASADNRCLIVDGELHSFAPAGLDEYSIPDCVTEITGGAFHECSSLKSVTIGNGVTSIGVFAFSDCTSLESITISESVTNIGVQAFQNCPSLKTFKGKFASPDNRCLIFDGELKFFAPAGLVEYAIPEGVTSIGTSVFSDCKTLKRIIIHSHITEIGDYAFYNCVSLSEIYCKSTTPPAIGEGTFSCLFYHPHIDRKIYVPTASVNKYKRASGWMNYTSLIHSCEKKKEDYTERRYYKVRSGDHLGLIAKRNHTTVAEICRLNGIKPNAVFPIGKVLRVK